MSTQQRRCDEHKHRASLLASIQRACAFLFLLLRSSVQDKVSGSYYHSALDLNFLCSSSTMPAFVREVPWDCTSYVVCLRGRAFHSQCPPDKLYSSKSQKCLFADLADSSRCLGKIFDYADDICRANPNIRIPSPDSCGHYIDCKARTDIRRSEAAQGITPDFMDGLLECSYPFLFSPATGDCQHFSYVNCRQKFEPKAPCDYLQYAQLYQCKNLDCSVCQQHHPSCLTRGDGYHPVPERQDVMMKCQKERTVDFITCPPGYAFSLPNRLRLSGSAFAVSPVTSPVCVRTL